MSSSIAAADFIAKNMNTIIELGKGAYGRITDAVKKELNIAYTDYLDNAYAKHSKAKSFFIRDQSVDLYSYYVPTGISCAKIEIENPTFDSCIKHSKRYVITGTGGCGKSVLMRHLFLGCMQSAKYVPILIELRELNADYDNLDDLIKSCLHRHGFNLTDNFIKNAKKSGHLAFFFDGYDEVSHSKRIKLIKAIKDLSCKYPNGPLFISTRPDEVFNGIEEFNIFKVLPLDLDSAVKLIDKLPFDPDIKSKFIAKLKDGLFKKHESFLSNPLLLSIMLLTYGENAEIPNKISVFYNQAYEALFQRHDARKGGGLSRARKSGLDIQDFARVFSMFSLLTYEKRLFRMPKTKCLEIIENSRNLICMDVDAEDYLADLLGAACLLIEDGLEISFSHRSFQEYFVALHISKAEPKLQKKLIERYWANGNSDNVINLLLEIDPELIERVLLIPMLDKIFTQIGVKKRIGVTHATKYLKLAFENFSLDDDILATNRKSSNNTHRLVRLIVGHCGNYCWPDEKYFEKHRKSMVRKYGKSEKYIIYSTSQITHRDPFVIDILKSKGNFSIEYLQTAFDALEKLIEKHKNQELAIEELFG